MKKRCSAFTLIEASLALVVTCIVIAVIAMTLPTVQRVSRRTISSPLDFELLLAELEDHDHDFQLLNVTPTSCHLLDSRTHKKFTLKCQGRIYLTSSGGYMELLDNIIPCSMTCNQLDKSRVIISVRRKNGEKQYGTVKFKPARRDKETNSEK